MQLDAGVSGRALTTQVITVGILSTGNIVPQRNVIGRIMKLLNAFMCGRSLTFIPAATPNRENTVQEIRTVIISMGVISRSSVRKKPSASMIDAQSIDFNMPNTAFPSMMDVLETGHNIISSKLS